MNTNATTATAKTPLSIPVTESLTRLSSWRASDNATERWPKVTGSFGSGKPYPKISF